MMLSLAACGTVDVSDSESETVLQGEELAETLTESLTKSLTASLTESLTEALMETASEEDSDTSTSEATPEAISEATEDEDDILSAYDEWQTAMYSGNNRDGWEAVGAAYKEMEKRIQRGFYNDPSAKAYVAMLVNADKLTGNLETDFAMLTETIEGTSHCLMDYWTYDVNDNLVTNGLFNFLKDIIAVQDQIGDGTIEYAGIDENGYWWYFPDDIDPLLDWFGTTETFLELFSLIMQDVTDSAYWGD